MSADLALASGRLPLAPDLGPRGPGMPPTAGGDPVGSCCGCCCCGCWRASALLGLSAAAARGSTSSCTQQSLGACAGAIGAVSMGGVNVVAYMHSVRTVAWLGCSAVRGDGRETWALVRGVPWWEVSHVLE